jgi:Concanavalin A-like lectin/glucanases superfamily
MRKLVSIALLVFALPVMAGRHFNGSTDKIQATSGSLLLGAGNATIVCAFMVTSLPGSTEVNVCSNGGQEGGPSHQGPVMVEIGSNFYGSHYNSIGVVWWQNQSLNHNVDLFCAATISTNTWYTVVATFFSSGTPGAYLFVNGTQCATSGTANVLTVQNGADVPDFCMGGYASSGSPGVCGNQNFAGTIANFYVWTVYIPPGQAQALSLICPAGVTARRMGFPPPARAWPLTGASGTSIEPDLSGHGFNGTVTGTTVANQPPCTP